MLPYIKNKKWAEGCYESLGFSNASAVPQASTSRCNDAVIYGNGARS